jgi:hypothetical protein
MTTATLRDGHKVRVGDLVEFFGEPRHVVSGTVIRVYRARADSNSSTKGWVGLSMLLVKGGDYICEVPAREAWKANT